VTFTLLTPAPAASSIPLPALLAFSLDLLDALLALGLGPGGQLGISPAHARLNPLMRPWRAHLPLHHGHTALQIARAPLQGSLHRTENIVR
jgi:hypothetical protein